MGMKTKEFWFVVGSQFLYGPEVLDTVAKRAAEMADWWNQSGVLPCTVVYKATVKTDAEITGVMREANHDENCLGVITWCHTFSPSKMWIHGFDLLRKPYGDREHGFIGARMRLAVKVIAGFWQDRPVLEELGAWMRSAVGYDFSRKLKVIRFGDNMRDVAVTEGDKVEAQIKLGWQVDYWPVGHLVETMEAVTEDEVEAQMAQYRERYDMDTDNEAAVRYQAREEAAMRKILEREGAMAFSNNFQDLYGMEQLPGIATQNMMADGYGYGGEGDWKVAAMTALMKEMASGLEGGTLFMEDYTYDLEPGDEVSLGAHMLEVCPSIAAQRPRIQVHPLGIGDRQPPARLVFEGKEGPGIVVSLIDMGGRLRLIVQDIQVIKPILDMPNLPVARVMWKAKPDLVTGLKCWVLAGGAHHTVLSTAVTAQMMKDWAAMMGIECVHICQGTNVEDFEKELFYNDVAWKLKNL